MQHAKLWKRILNEGLDHQHELGIPDVTTSVIGATIIVDTRLPGRKDIVNWNEIHALAVPFETVWIEGALNGADQWGCLIYARDHFDAESNDWAICGVTFAGIAGLSPKIIGTSNIRINRQGDILSDRTFFVASPQSIRHWGTEMARLFSGQVPWLAMDVLRLMSCKNVSLEPHDTEPKQVRRAIKRHGGTPESYRYHTLVVRPPGAKTDSPAQDIGIMPRHVCRGHFAEYGPEFNKGLLFGKYAGRFYVPPHLKGDKKNGVVEKDYELSPALIAPTAS